MFFCRTTVEKVRKIIHVDMDAFFASVEERDFPELRGYPLAVGSPKERGVVATANYVARRYGVHSAMSSKIALQRCPQLIFRPARFEVYKSVSRQIHEIFHAYTDLVEPLSIDEAYLDVTENKVGQSSATLLAKEIKRKILETTRLTASAGVSYNKFLAKIASDVNKPDGLFVVEPAVAVAFIAELPVEKFYGIGKVTAYRLKSMNILKGADLQKLSLADMCRIFGKTGYFFYNIVRGIDTREVDPNRERKSFSVENTFENDLETNFAVVTELYHAEQRLWDDVSKSGKLGKTVTLKVRFSDFSTITRSCSSARNVRTFKELHFYVKKLLSEVDFAGRPVRLLGIGISNLSGVESVKSRQLRMKFK